VKLLRRLLDVAALVPVMLGHMTHDARDHLAVVAVTELDLLVGVLGAVARCHLKQRLGARLVGHIHDFV